MAKLNGSLKRGLIIAFCTVLSAGTLAGSASLIKTVWGNQSAISVVQEDVKEIKGDVKTLLTRK